MYHYSSAFPIIAINKHPFSHIPANTVTHTAHLLLYSHDRLFVPRSRRARLN